MLVQSRVNVFYAIKVTGTKFFFFFIFAMIIGVSSVNFGFHQYLLPKILVTIFAAPVGIFLAFRINSGYGRWWWARKIWGELVVNSRSFGLYVTSLMTESGNATEEEKELHRQLIFGHMGFINALRLNLRKQSEQDWDNELWNRKINGQYLFSEDEIAKLKKKVNKSTNIMIIQAKKIASYFKNENPYKQVKLNEIIRENYFCQGKSELIKATVFPWGYGFYTRVLAWALAILFALSQVNSADIHHIIVVAIIGTAFITIEQVGRNLDNPFEDSFNDTPMSALCRLIEIDLLQQLDQVCDLKPILPTNGQLN